eukprot:6993775-Karenia_brevis.AAC.1
MCAGWGSKYNPTALAGAAGTTPSNTTTEDRIEDSEEDSCASSLEAKTPTLRRLSKKSPPECMFSNKKRKAVLKQNIKQYQKNALQSSGARALTFSQM